MLPRTLFLLSALALFAAVLLAVCTPRPTGYELSLYGDLSPRFFLCIYLASACAIALLLLDAADPLAPWLPFGLFLVMSSNLLQLSLPIYLGFPVHHRADALNHIGYVQDILNTGSIGPLDFYPALHLLQLAVQSVPGVSSGAALLLLNLLFSILWSLAPLLFVLILTGSRSAASLAAAFSGVLWLLYYHNAILPSLLSAFLIPLLLALFIWRERSLHTPEALPVAVFLVLSLFLLVFLHPATALITLFLLVAYKLSQLILPHVRGIRLEPSSARSENGWSIILFLAALFFGWYFSNAFFVSRLAAAFHWLFTGRLTPSALGEAVGLLQTAGLPPLQAFSILLNAFALPVLLAALTFLFALLFILHHLRRRLPLPRSLLHHITIYFIALAVALASFLVSTSERHPLRLLRVAAVLAVPYLAWWLWEALYASPSSARWPSFFTRRRPALKTVFFLFLFLALLLAQRNLYEHPRNGLPNSRITAADLAGMRWFVANRLLGNPVAADLPQYTSRFASYFLGYAGRRQQPDWWHAEIWLPSNFYAPSWACISSLSPGLPAYIVLSDDARIASQRFPASVRARAHSYDLSAWTRLAADPTASRLYDNGAFQTWLTHPSAPCPPDPP